MCRSFSPPHQPLSFLFFSDGLQLKAFWEEEKDNLNTHFPYPILWKYSPMPSDECLVALLKILVPNTFHHLKCSITNKITQQINWHMVPRSSHYLLFHHLQYTHSQAFPLLFYVIRTWTVGRSGNKATVNNYIIKVRWLPLIFILIFRILLMKGGLHVPVLRTGVWLQRILMTSLWCSRLTFTAIQLPPLIQFWLLSQRHVHKYARPWWQSSC